MSYINVELRSCGGELLRVAVEPETKVHMLKDRVATDWNIPKICQQILVGTVALADDDEVTLHASDGGASLSATVVVNLNAVIEAHSSVDPRLRVKALLCLARLGKRGGEEAWNAIQTSIQDPIESVKQQAIMAIPSVASTGDVTAVSLLLSCLREGSVSVQMTACEVLAATAVKGDPGVVNSLCACLDHFNADVRQFAVCALSKLATKGDVAVIATLFRFLEDDSWIVRLHAVYGLVVVAEKGDEATIAAVRRHLDDDDNEVSRASEEALAQLSTLSRW